jgi:GTP-binding protein HflX
MTQQTIANVKGERTKAVLVSVQLQSVDNAEHEASLAELGRLVDTLGFDVVGHVSQKRRHLSPQAGLGAGKLKTLAVITGGTGIIPSGASEKVQKKDLRKLKAEDLENDDDEDEDDDDIDEVPQVKAAIVIVDNELSPSQLRNLERACGVQVIDRSGVIIEIFHRHAHTREARLQVEIARLSYEAPRLREKESDGSRQRGGGVGGKGDEDIEIDKRRVRDRLVELREELKAVQIDEENRRSRRKDALRVALVGYTNAGKSSLMRALTGSDVLIADKLFATLGTTVRAIHPETQPRILVSDTVGFIKNLPHGLVASFKSTLDEAHEASLLLFTVDASDPAFRTQLDVTTKVLSEIGAQDIPRVLVLNKIDRVDEDTRRLLRGEFQPGTSGFLDVIQLSALDKLDVQRLYARIVAFFEAGFVEETVRLPFSAAHHLGVVREHARVISEDWDEEGAKLVVRAPPTHLARMHAALTGKHAGEHARS